MSFGFLFQHCSKNRIPTRSPFKVEPLHHPSAHQYFTQLLPVVLCVSPSLLSRPCSSTTPLLNSNLRSFCLLLCVCHPLSFQGRVPPPPLCSPLLYSASACCCVCVTSCHCLAFICMLSFFFYLSFIYLLLNK